MKYHAQFQVLHNQVWDKQQGELVEVIPYLQDKLGSDGVYILDGRNSLSTMIQDCYDRIDRLKNIYRVDGFEIRRGTKFSDSKVIYQSLQLN